jgi:hypothetical protein
MFKNPIVETAVSVEWVKCDICGTVSRSENGIVVKPHTQLDCYEAVEWQEICQRDDKSAMDAHLRRCNRRLFEQSPKVYCERCNAVFAGTHRHIYQDGAMYEALPLADEN